MSRGCKRWGWGEQVGKGRQERAGWGGNVGGSVDMQTGRSRATLSMYRQEMGLTIATSFLRSSMSRLLVALPFFGELLSSFLSCEVAIR